MPPTDRAKNAILRRSLLALVLGPLLLAACDTSPPAPTEFPPLTFDYLSKLRLSVATIDVTNEAATQGGGGDPDLAALAPVAPADALTRMEQDRLLAFGTSGHAVFVIEQASLARVPGGFGGTMRVRLDVSTSDGTKSGFAEAQVSRTYSTADTSDAGTKAALYDLVKLMMADMNVEFEYQVKHKLRDYLQLDGAAPAPPPVESQDLNTGAPVPAPDAAPAPAPDAAPAPTPPQTLAPPPAQPAD